MKHQETIQKYIPEGFHSTKEGNMIRYEVAQQQLEEICRDLYFKHKLPLKIITAIDETSTGVGFKIFYVFGIPHENVFLSPYIVLKDTMDFPSITRYIHEASGYERKIKSFFGLQPTRHPHLRQMILHENWPAEIFPLRKDFNWKNRPEEAHGTYTFQKIHGEGIYEIPVGPVHAGIIEPGHFRFSVLGEVIKLLEPKLGYTHKGSEKLFEILSMEDKLKLSERISGDSSFTHSLAFCQAVETLADITVPERAQYLRVIFSELERIANHLNDIGFIMMDTGYSFGGASGSRLREMIMQWNEKLTKSRFLRGVNTIGGVKCDITTTTAQQLLKSLKSIQGDFNEVVEIAKNSSSLNNRLVGTGKLDYQIAHDHGVIGVAGRAMNMSHDARKEYPYAAYNSLQFEIALEKEGDVRARWLVRINEVSSSMALLDQALSHIPPGQLKAEMPLKLQANSCAIGITEGWRGDIVYFVVTDKNGQITRVDVRDPSFLNWAVVGHVCYGSVVPDFPLINKSFNLSYSGHDL